MFNSQKKLNDPEIRLALSKYLQKKNFEDNEILEELHVCNGRAIADVVTLKEGVHCFEIKGDGDKIERILQQNVYFEKSFRRISVVTTDKHLKKALDIAPSHWGVMVARVDKSEEVVIRSVRRAKINHAFDKTTALLVLRKNEMLEMLPSNDKKIERNSRAVLADLIARNKKNYQVSREIGCTLTSRKNFKFQS